MAQEENPGYLEFLASIAWWTTKKTAKTGFWITKKTAKFLYHHRREIAQGTGMIASAGAGLVKGTAEFLYNSGCLVYYDQEKLNTLEEKIKQQSRQYGLILEDKKAALDAGIVGGICLTDYLSHDAQVPPLVKLAYKIQYPDLAEKQSFEQAIENYSPEQLPGFLAGIKGKIFEIQYTDYLNNGHLPEGYTAELASSATQAGWDIKILGPDRQIAEVLQCKATDSVSYLTEAAEKYPDIDIVTFDDTYAQLVMHSNLESAGMINSGISSEDITALLDHASNTEYGLDDFLNLKIPIASLALIALTEYMDSDKGVYTKSFSFGDRSAKSIIALTAGGVVAGITGVWILAPLGALGTRYIAGKGKQMRLNFDRLTGIASKNEQAIYRMKQL